MTAEDSDSLLGHSSVPRGCHSRVTPPSDSSGQQILSLSCFDRAAQSFKMADETCGPRAGVALTMGQAQTLLDYHLPGRRCVAIRYVDRGYNNRTYVVQLDIGSEVARPVVNGSTNSGPDVNGSEVTDSDMNESKVSRSILERSKVALCNGNVPNGFQSSADMSKGPKRVVNGAEITLPEIKNSKVTGSEIIVRLGGRFWTKRKTENEVACLAYLRDLRPRVPVPRVLFYGSSRALIGAEYIGMELLPGRPLDEAWPDLTKAQRLIAVGQLAEILAEIRSLTFDKVGNLGFKLETGKILPDASDVFVDQCFEVGYGPLPDHSAFVKAIFQGAMDTFMTHTFFCPLRPHLAPRLRSFSRACFKDRQGAMANALASPADVVMTHYDLEPRNVLVDAHGGVTGLLDWEFAGAFPADVEWFSSLEFLGANTAEACADAMSRAGKDALSGAGDGIMSFADDATHRAENIKVIRTNDDAINGVAEDATHKTSEIASSQIAEEALGRVSEDAMSLTGNDALSGARDGAMACIHEETSRYQKHFMNILKSRGVDVPPEAHRERHLKRADFWVLQDNMSPWYLQQVGKDASQEAIAQRTQAADIVDAILRKYGF